MKTTKLNNGATVLADEKHSFNGKPYAKTYANRTQAERKANDLRNQGVSCHVRQFSRPFYVVVDA